MEKTKKLVRYLLFYMSLLGTVILVGVLNNFSVETRNDYSLPNILFVKIPFYILVLYPLVTFYSSKFEKLFKIENKDDRRENK